MMYFSYFSKHHKLLGDHLEPNRCREVPWGSIDSTAIVKLVDLRSASPSVVDQVHSQFNISLCGTRETEKKRVPAVSSSIRINKYYPGSHKYYGGFE